MTDADLLNQFVQTRSSDAFAAIVQRYVDLVHSTARRMIRDENQVQDVVQATFLVLVKKASRVDPRTLPGWLVRTCRFAAQESQRRDRRRARHEMLAAEMRPPSVPVEEPPAEQIAPLLDAALSKLNELDRTAVVLRFLQAASFAEIGSNLGCTEEAARKRVNRALGKLRRIFQHQNLLLSDGGLMVVLAALQSKTAPPALAQTIAASSTGGTATTAATAICRVISTRLLIATSTKIAAIIAAICIALTAGAELLTRHFASHQVPPANSLSATLGVAAGSPAIAMLANGTQFELVSVNYDNAASLLAGAWRPDGTPLQPGLLSAPPKARPGLPKGTTSLTFTYRTRNPANNSNVQSIGEGTFPGTDMGGIALDLPNSNGLQQLGILLQSSNPTLKFAILKPENWIPETIIDNLPNKGPWGATVPSLGDVMVNDIIRGSRPNVTVVDIDRPALSATPAMAINLVLVDKSGNEINAEMVMNWPPVGNRDNQEFQFPVAYEQVHELIVRARHYAGFIEFRNFSLEPGRHSDVQIIVTNKPSDDYASQRK